jgi:hypothetical protein
MEINLTKAAYITVKIEENLWFLTITARDIDKFFCKKYIFQALVCKTERDKVHVPYRKQKNNFRVIFVNKSSINETKQ